MGYRIEVDLDWSRLGDPSTYLGATESLIDRILDEARTIVG